MDFGAENYRIGALERLRESKILLDSNHLGGAIYLAGRGVEGMLRAVIWKRDMEIRQGKKSLETGHDLRQLLIYVQDLGLLLDGSRDDKFKGKIQSVAAKWSNDFRFAPEKFIESFWWKRRIVTEKKRLKMAAGEYVQDCSDIVNRCEKLCED